MYNARYSVFSFVSHIQEIKISIEFIELRLETGTRACDSSGVI